MTQGIPVSMKELKRRAAMPRPPSYSKEYGAWWRANKKVEAARSEAAAKRHSIVTQKTNS